MRRYVFILESMLRHIAGSARTNTVCCIHINTHHGCYTDGRFMMMLLVLPIHCVYGRSAWRTTPADSVCTYLPTTPNHIVHYRIAPIYGYLWQNFCKYIPKFCVKYFTTISQYMKVMYVSNVLFSGYMVANFFLPGFFRCVA